MPVTVNLDNCIGCESCIGMCPVGALAMEDVKANCDEYACIDCGACCGVCPTSALSQ